MALSLHERPIGIFDSGIGGLIVARAVQQALPQETIVYFGDTAHLPYGDKPAALIQARACAISDLLLQKQCKAIVIACHSASAAATEVVQAHVGSHALVLNVIDPVVAYLGQHFQQQPLGLIGTQQTVQSGIYQQKVQALQQGIVLRAVATPRLAPLIEAGWTHNPLNQAVLQRYLQSPTLQSIRALVLGCTHYPILQKELEAYYQHQVAIIDAAALTALHLKQCLTQHQLLSLRKKRADHLMVSALTPHFVRASCIFFDQPVHLEAVAHT